MRVIEAVQEVRTTAELAGVELSATQLAERFGFANERQWTPVADLSGGEQRRLQLLRLLLAEPNVLLLDEPTNDLDTDTLAALEDLLDSWPGTLVVVSHDRYLIERVCDSTVALLGDGSLAALPGGVEQYLALRRAVDGPGADDQLRPIRRRDAGQVEPGPGRGRPSPRPANAKTGQGQGPGRPARRPQGDHPPGTPDRQARRPRGGDPSPRWREHATDYARVSALDAELQKLAGDKDAAENAWLELSSD